MTNPVTRVIQAISDTYRDDIAETGRHYREVDIGREAEKLGITEISPAIRTARAIIPLKKPACGMKVRIDGRTFVDYARLASGVAVPGYVARAADLPYRAYVPEDSMILNCA